MKHLDESNAAKALRIVTQTGQGEEPPPFDITSLPVLHLYHVNEGKGLLFLREEAEQTTPDTPGSPDPLATVASHPTIPFVPPKQNASKTWLLAPALVLLVNIAIVLTIFFLDIYPILTQQVTITIIPQSHLLSATQTLTTVHSRLFAPLTLSQSQTVQATGKRHQDATTALGTITFYNGLFSVQYVPAGTILTGSDGVAISTDQAATIPPAQATTPPTYGNATVQAHAVSPGSSGNIPTRDINYTYGSVLAQNTVPFQQGQDSRDYFVVTADDISTTIAALTPRLTSTMQTALHKNLHPGETLLTPSCHQDVSSTHQVGEEAQTVTITLMQQCTSAAYSSASFHQEAIKAAEEKAAHLFGTGYTLAGQLQVTLKRFTIKNSSIAFTIGTSGMWLYQFSPREQSQFLQKVAGKKEAQALTLLATRPGIQTVHISGIAPNAALPQDISRIHVLIVYFPTAYGAI